jgi:hypothetical protein
LEKPEACPTIAVHLDCTVLLTRNTPLWDEALSLLKRALPPLLLLPPSPPGFAFVWHEEALWPSSR